MDLHGLFPKLQSGSYCLLDLTLNLYIKIGLFSLIARPRSQK